MVVLEHAKVLEKLVKVMLLYADACVFNLDFQPLFDLLFLWRLLLRLALDLKLVYKVQCFIFVS